MAKLIRGKQKKTCAAAEIEDLFRARAVQIQIFDPREVYLQPALDISILRVTVG